MLAWIITPFVTLIMLIKIMMSNGSNGNSTTEAIIQGAKDAKEMSNAINTIMEDDETEVTPHPRNRPNKVNDNR